MPTMYYTDSQIEMFKAVKLQGVTSLQLRFCVLMHIAPIKPELRLFSLFKVFLRLFHTCASFTQD